jgi:hypothetical protein
MNNPLDYVTLKDIQELGLSENELKTAYQPSGGGVFHARGAEGTGKTLWIAHFYKFLIDSGLFTPYDATGNISFKGKYGLGYTVKKGETLHEYLWNMTHIPYRHKIVIIDEIDSEFPARFFANKEQTEIALRMWHVQKLDNFVLMSSHIGNSTDLIYHLASHYLIYPKKPCFETNTMDFTIVSNLELWNTEMVAHDIVKTMLIYNRKELTEDMNTERTKKRAQKKQAQQIEFVELEEFDLDADKEQATL